MARPYDWKNDSGYDRLIAPRLIKPLVCESMRKGDLIKLLIDDYYSVQDDPGKKKATDFTYFLFSIIGLDPPRYNITPTQIRNMIQIITSNDPMGRRTPTLSMWNLMYHARNILTNNLSKDLCYDIIKLFSTSQLCALHRDIWKHYGKPSDEDMSDDE